MKYIIASNSLLAFSLFIFFPVFSQDCKVEKKDIKGTYTGDCKRGKADGKGKAVGTDTYEGEFKSGLPDGEGIYTWANGDVYSGHFTKGHLDGKGFMKWKRPNAEDSTEGGFWKDDEYKGKYEKPYKINSVSMAVTNVIVKFKKDKINRVSFLVRNTTSSTASLNDKNGTKNVQPLKMKVDNIGLSLGGYTRMEYYEYMKKTETILFNASYPMQMKLTVSSELIDMELLEEGSYIIEIEINR